MKVERLQVLCDSCRWSRECESWNELLSFEEQTCPSCGRAKILTEEEADYARHLRKIAIVLRPFDAAVSILYRLFGEQVPRTIVRVTTAGGLKVSTESDDEEEV